MQVVPLNLLSVFFGPKTRAEVIKVRIEWSSKAVEYLALTSETKFMFQLCTIDSPSRHITISIINRSTSHFHYSIIFRNMDEIPEELFLDIPITNIQRGTSGTKTVELWATLYCKAVIEQRYGDAIHARYSLDGRSPDGINQDTKRTVLEEIRLDAVSYYLAEPEAYAQALLFYLNNSSDNTRPEIVEVVRQAPH